MIYFCYVVFVNVCLNALVEISGNAIGNKSQFDCMIRFTLFYCPALIALSWLMWGQE